MAEKYDQEFQEGAHVLRRIRWLKRHLVWEWTAECWENQGKECQSIISSLLIGSAVSGIRLKLYKLAIITKSMTPYCSHIRDNSEIKTEKYLSGFIASM